MWTKGEDHQLKYKINIAQYSEFYQRAVYFLCVCSFRFNDKQKKLKVCFMTAWLLYNKNVNSIRIQSCLMVNVSTITIEYRRLKVILFCFLNDPRRWIEMLK